MSIVDSLMFKVGLDTSGVSQGLSKTKSTIGAFSTGAVVAISAVGAAVAGVAGGLASIGAAAVQTGTQFETLEARLATLLGSTGAARDRMESLFEISSSTPFNLDQLVEVDATLEAFGVNAEKFRGPVMDLAGAMGLDLTAAAEQVGKSLTAGAGSADLLRERGVLTMIKLQEGMDPLKMSTEELEQAMYRLFTDPQGKIAGGTARLAATFEGLVSNLEDQWAGFTKQVADAGTFNAVKGGLRETLAILDENKELVGEVAEAIGVGLVESIRLGVSVTAVFAQHVRSVAGFWAFVGAKGVDALSGVIQAVGVADSAIAGLFDSIGLSSLSSSLRSEAEGAFEFARGLASTSDSMQAFADSTADTNENIAALAERLISATYGSTTLTPAVEKAATATKSLAKAEDEQDKKRQKDLADQAAALRQLQDMRNEANQALMEEAQLIRAKAEADIASIQIIADKHRENQAIQAEAEEAIHARRRQMAEELAELDRQIGEDLLKGELDRRKKEEQLHNERLQEMQERANSALQGAATFAGGFSALAAENAKRLAETDKEAAMKAFRRSKGLAVAESGINQALAIGRAWATLGPVGASLATAGIVALFAAQVAQIVAQEPAFDVGGVIGGSGLMASRSPDQVNIRALPGESVLNRQATERLGPDGVNRLNSGRGMAPVVVPVPVYKHFGRFAQDEVRRNRALGASIRRDRTPGRRGY